MHLLMCGDVNDVKLDTSNVPHLKHAYMYIVIHGGMYTHANICWVTQYMIICRYNTTDLDVKYSLNTITIFSHIYTYYIVRYF